MVARLLHSDPRLLRASLGGVLLGVLGVLGVLAVLACAGCDRHAADATANSRTEHHAAGAPTAPSVATSAPITPATLAAASTQPTTQSSARPRAVMTIDEKRFEFPPAILRVKPKADKLLVLLMSDDPKDALDENYAGNSFYLEMPVDAADLKDLSSAVWNFAAPTSERTDSPDGIFLDGNRKQLQASNVTVRFEADATDPDHPKAMAVAISGTFLLFDTRDDNVPAKLVPVVAHLAAEVKAK